MPREVGTDAAGRIVIPGVYATLLDRERRADARCDVIRLYPPDHDDAPVMRRPRQLLDALEAGQPATVSAHTVNVLYWTGRGSEVLPWPASDVRPVVVRPDDTVTPADTPT